jgi:dihydroorotate dehydrogenase (NAD+) catalytic subunit
MSADLRVEVGGVPMANPIMLASGTVGYGEEVGEMVDLSRLGGIVVKGLSRQPWVGNPPQRIAETPGGMLNSIGLQNIGVEAFVRDKLPALSGHSLAVVANIWGRTIEDYVEVASYLDEVEGVDGLELNVSCPNIKEGGISFGTSESQIHKVTAAVRSATTKPLWVKLAPGVTDIGAIARAAEEGGADALSVINTVRGMMVDVQKRAPVLSSTFGGFSGPALFPIALYCLYEVDLATSLPLIGIGGISSLDQILQFLIVGASAVQIGTANFYDPTISERMVRELEAWVSQEGLAALADLVGTLQR